MGFSRLLNTALAVTFLAAGCSTTPAAVRVIPTDAGALPKLHSLSASASSPYELGRTIASHEATLLVWYATTCPCVLRYQARIQDLAGRYAPRNVAVVGVSSNSDDTADRLRAHIAKHEVTFPVVMDPHGRLAKLLGVETTPTVVLLDRDGAVRYRGWIDNERRLGQSGRKPWLEDALKSVLADRTVVESATTPRGCQITRSVSSACGRCSRHAQPVAPTGR